MKEVRRYEVVSASGPLVGAPPLSAPLLSSPRQWHARVPPPAARGLPVPRTRTQAL